MLKVTVINPKHNRYLQKGEIMGLSRTAKGVNVTFEKGTVPEFIKVNDLQIEVKNQ